MIRRPRFAGDWYPGEPVSLRAALDSFVRAEAPESRALGIVCPHAGYVYSGAVAGRTYARVRVPNLAVVACVNHRGIGARAALMASGSWETPLGAVPVDANFCRLLLQNCPLLVDDPSAHQREHSLELQLPFLQYRNPHVRLAPICLQDLSYAECEELGRAVARTVRTAGEQALLVASTDMSHFEPQEVARKLDRQAIERILALDPKGLYEVVRSKRISMCGVIPTTAVLSACLELGASQTDLVCYATSGDVSGDFSSVVGYAGIVIA